MPIDRNVWSTRLYGRNIGLGILTKA